mmetsp:Transcript_51494/g.75369  ORF Transcript_51494/g.75369 Transcript_51494/m.75369 type:complete len:133 (-) Transcript_51494:20-418(-)
MMDLHFDGTNGGGQHPVVHFLVGILIWAFAGGFTGLGGMIIGAMVGEAVNRDPKMIDEDGAVDIEHYLKVFPKGAAIGVFAHLVFYWVGVIGHLHQEICFSICIVHGAGQFIYAFHLNFTHKIYHSANNKRN